MNRLLTIILIVFPTFLGQSLFGQMGRAVLTYQRIYEEDNSYFPHDYFVTVDMDEFLDTAVSIKGTEQKLIIDNHFNDGFVGHIVRFEISSDLEIKNVQYKGRPVKSDVNLPIRIKQ